MSEPTGGRASGSALVTNLSTSPGDGTGTTQCIEDLSGGRIYRIAADISVPSGQAETGNANLLVQWYDQPGCSSGQIGLFLSPAIPTSTPDVWYTIVESVEAPHGTQAARLRLTVTKLEDSGSLDAKFDNVGFEYYLFSAGFESSDTSAWSSVIGGT